MSNGKNISCNSASAASKIINLMGTGIPTEMALRELVVNGIEACLRNNNEADQHGVFLCRDHEHHDKLSVINVGGDFLSENIFLDNLATLANTGNNTKGGQNLFDDNKGVGAKIAYLPKARKGLKYRSKKKGDSDGITAQMKEDRNTNNYFLPSSFCEVMGVNTCFPYCDKFHKKLKNNTGTEVVCMGDYDGEDTWELFDTLSKNGRLNSIDGTGYGLLKYFNLRFYDAPAVDVNVGIYSKDKKFRQWRKVRGLKANMNNEGKASPCVDSGVVPLNYEGLDIKAHWAIIKDRGEKGVYANILGSGFTSVAWKGENYVDLNQKPMSIKKDLQNCGVIFKWNKVVIVFEIDRKHMLQTDTKRDELYLDSRKIDKNILHELFRENFPEKLRVWQEENRIKTSENVSIEKTLHSQMKDMGFGGSLRKEGNSTIPLKAKNNSNLSKTTTNTKKKPINKKTSKRSSSISKLNNFSTILFFIGLVAIIVDLNIIR